MSRTITMLLWHSSNSASPMTCRASRSYPRVSHCSDAATRAGVFIRPSRAGSSPMSSSCLLTRSARSSVSCVFDIVVFGFAKNETRELRWSDGRLEDPPELNYYVLRRGNDSLHELNVEVEVLVIDLVDNLGFDDVTEPGEIEHIARWLVDLSFDGDFEIVIVPMPVGVVALPERGFVFRVGERGIENAMRRVEAQAASDGDSRHIWSARACARKKLRRHTTATA